MKCAERKPAANAVSSDAATGAENVQENDAPLPLPHETDQSAESQHEEGTLDVGRQAHQDLSRGLTDTDRRGGDAYQQRKQKDANTNTQSPEHEVTCKR
ncbi:hypothetical protein AYM40_09940 [Paraburkholderia phytofirmans OLGA172]|uniref:Uncharacterized protein n=1 Tax=Paraburkholderia phytofirmans OLGA172 TaxID=1417228 RepID=A0A161I6K2_9BURK|nr:hypothetical protein [Paraburkholderia phytofirmans]ANB72653.1 hypothetical protein AYM40_09940 [Paraburkholderia phytofirmans OLGA172]